MRRALVASLAILLSASLYALADETPKDGGTLTYMIPADAPPSFDGHREATFATVHAVAPFYSVLVRANPDNPADTTNFVCDVCTAIAEPTDGGRTWSFTIRSDVRFSDGATMTADDVAASWNHIVDPPAGVISARQGYLRDDRQGRGGRPADGRLSPEIRDERLSAGARRPLCLHLQKGNPRPRPALV